MQPRSINQNHSIIFGALAISLASTLIASPTRAEQITVPPGYAVEQISTGPFALVQPSGLAVGQDNSIYIGRNFFSGQSDLLKINPSGDVAEIASFNAFIGGLAINSMGQLFGSLNNQTIFEYQNGGVATFATGLPQFSAEHLDFDGQNNLYVAYFNAKEIIRVSPTGVPSVFVSGLGGPFGVTFRNGVLFVGDNLNNGNGPGIVDEIGPSGGITNTVGPIPGRIVDLKYANNAQFQGFFIANQNNPGVDRIIDNQITTFSNCFTEYPRALSFGPDGSLYVTDASSLYRITVVPEPSSLVLAGIGGLIGLGYAWHRRKRATA